MATHARCMSPYRAIREDPSTQKDTGLYLGELEERSDSQLLYELKYQAQRTGFLPFEEGSQPDVFVKKMLRMHLPRDAPRWALEGAERSGVQKACVVIRHARFRRMKYPHLPLRFTEGNFVEMLRLHRLVYGGEEKAGEPKRDTFQTTRRRSMALLRGHERGIALTHRQRLRTALLLRKELQTLRCLAIKLPTDWELLCLVVRQLGNCHFTGTELTFLALQWADVVWKGRNLYRLSTKQRQWLESIALESVYLKDRVLVLEQIWRFKEIAGVDVVRFTGEAIQPTLDEAPWDGTAERQQLL